MANKSLGTRQKLSFRIEPSQRAKPRNPVAVAAKSRKGGPHRKSTSALRQEQKQQLQRTADVQDEGDE